MVLSSFKRYDVQAQTAIVLAGASVIPLLAAAWLVMWKYEHQLGQIVYGSKGSFLPVLLGCVLLSAGAAGTGFLLGLTSAGQRRNDKPRRAWMGFFLGGSVLTANVIIVLALLMLRLEKPIP